MISYKAKIAYCHKIKDKDGNYILNNDNGNKIITQTAGEGITDIKGAVINSKSDNLTLETKDLTYSNIQDTYYTETKGSNFSTTIGSDPDKGKANISPMGSTTIGLKSTGSEKEQDTKATIGNGSIVITNKVNGKEIIANEGGTTNQNDLLAGLNRNKDNSQEITKDMITGALDGSMTIDNRLLFGFINQNVYERDEDGKVKKDADGKSIVMKDKNGNNITTNGYKSVGSDVKNFIPNTLNATIGALNTTSMILEKVLPSAPQTKFIQNEDGTYTVEPIFPKGPLGTALKYTAFVWNSPNTAIGLTAGALGTLGGAEFGKFDWDNLVFSVNNYPVGGGAITLGNVIIYSGVKENQTTYTYDFNHRQSLNPKLRPTNNDKTTFKQHEYPHVEQSYILGPFYLPVYLLSGGVGHWNWMEKQADKKGNEAWKRNKDINYK